MLTTTLTACQADEVAPPTAVTAAAVSSQCLVLDGLTNCAFGNATVAPSKAGQGLDVGGLGAADADGVATFLPDTHTFSMTGDGSADAAATEVSRAISKDEIISTMVAEHNANGLALTSAFTGSEAATYSAKLSKDGKPVGSIARLRSGTDGLQINPGPGGTAPLRIRIRIFNNKLVIVWHARAVESEVGACAWEVGFAEGSDPHVTLADGSSVAVDRVEMIENVTVAGSYPYLAFDRIDYSSNTGALQITGETAK